MDLVGVNLHYRGCGYETKGVGCSGSRIGTTTAMNGLQPSHEIRKLTIVLPAHVVDALRSQLRGDESITDCIKRPVIREAMGGANS
jgi:hypothetical protein